MQHGFKLVPVTIRDVSLYIPWLTETALGLVITQTRGRAFQTLDRAFQALGRAFSFCLNPQKLG